MFRKIVLSSVIVIASVSGAFAQEGDVKKGKKVFRTCKACHAVGENAKNKVGPVLNGVVGREVASVEGYKYSDAFKAEKEAGRVWDEEFLAAYLKDPKKTIPKNKMAFRGVKEKKLADIIAYLKSFNEDGTRVE